MDYEVSFVQHIANDLLKRNRLLTMFIN